MKCIDEQIKLKNSIRTDIKTYQHLLTEFDELIDGGNLIEYESQLRLEVGIDELIRKIRKYNKHEE